MSIESNPNLTALLDLCIESGAYLKCKGVGIVLWGIEVGLINHEYAYEISALYRKYIRELDLLPITIDDFPPIEIVTIGL